MITVSQNAKNKIAEAMQANEAQGMALRLAVIGRGKDGFRYSFSFVSKDHREPGDTLVEVDDLQIYVDPESVKKLLGTTLDYVENNHHQGFKIDNPNPLWTDSAAEAVQEVINTQINPGIAMHGGFVSLLEVKDGTAYIQFGGGCHGCGMADVTLKQGVEVTIHQAVPEITKVLDTTDHADGENPYYRPGRSGPSPLS